MNTNDRLAIIAKHKAEIDRKEKERKDATLSEIKGINDSIIWIQPRINDLFIVAQALLDAKMNVPPKFIADGINHRLGFILCLQTVDALGIIGGGYDGSDFFVLRNGTVCKSAITNIDEYPENKVRDFIDKGKRFIFAFDEFEKGFYEYVDNL